MRTAYDDFAILRVNTEFLPELTHASQKKVGDRVNWFRYNCEERFSGKIKDIFSGLHTNIWFDNFAQVGGSMPIPQSVIIERMTAEFIQVDFNTLHGSSGSPMLNEQGEVVGIVVIGDFITKDWRGVSVKDDKSFPRRGWPNFISAYPAGKSFVLPSQKK